MCCRTLAINIPEPAKYRSNLNCVLMLNLLRYVCFPLLQDNVSLDKGFLSLYTLPNYENKYLLEANIRNKIKIKMQNIDQ